jgi:hypothetical protein
MNQITTICNSNPGALVVIKLIMDTHYDKLNNIINSLQNNNIR